MTLTRADLTQTVAVLVADGQDSLIDQFAENLPATDLAPVLVRATAIRRALARLEKAIEVRYATEVAGPYSDETGEYEWKGTSKREIKDVPSFLMECLTDPKITPAALLPAVSGLKLTPLNELAKKSGIVAHALAEWTAWTTGPAHLTPKTKKNEGERP